MFVYVLNKNGQQIMPCKPAKARKLLRDDKAIVVSRTPFTIKLNWQCEGETQLIVAGMDTGSKKIGCAVVSNDKVLYQSEIEIRDNISKRMNRRAMYRKSRRSRKVRYRKPRWKNRVRICTYGKLTPSIKSKIDSHLREKKFVESILPVTDWKVEISSFDIHKISDSCVSKNRGRTYQDGQQKGFYNIKQYILYRDGYKCQHCKGKSKNLRLHVHHIVFRSNGGTDVHDNLICLCVDCHDRLHRREFELKGSYSKTKYATEINVIKSQIKKYFGDFKETFGYETKWKREQILKFPKTHYHDAVAICCEDGELVDLDDTVYYKKHIPKGDYKQTYGKHSEKRIPTGKLFGLRKFDLIKTLKGIGFVKGKRLRGVFSVGNICGDIIDLDIGIKKNCKRLTARTTTLIEKIQCLPCG